ncbi:hypothetical protein DFA_00718 [Cavenderia fasciculata]|uniref:Uncharacterized protein n=1 Tax=Cavenderia fasciculata TaxID=261658 RepID=F4PTH1_CACFS|nr:uncharacterized protein DFA_00718 [Cavenderia fasciculata]EGG20853.1 hypothetical protein DFA_00718 [Cavenderia fasciculata]|eukprot:XP_004358703.1 hypothetical protein DFA_00718 [Cavenderia fasciculata]
MHNWTLNTGVINDHLISNLIQKGDDPKGDFDQTGPDFSNSNFIPLTSLFMHLDRCVALSATQLARAGAPVTSPNKTAPISVSPSSSSPPPANININATNNGIGVGLGGNGSGSGNGGSGSFSNYNIANGGSISSATLFSSDYHNLNFVKHHYEAEMAIILQQSASTNNNNNNKK